MSDMKINNLVKYLKLKNFYHYWKNNVPLDISQQIYIAYIEKSNSMSIRTFVSYLTKFWLKRSTVQDIIKKWKNVYDPYDYKQWETYFFNNYKYRYKNTKRTNKIETLTNKQIKLIEDMRINNPSMGYKSFELDIYNTKFNDRFNELFWGQLISKRTFYDVINKLELPKAATKKQKLSMLSKMRKEWRIGLYYEKMKNTYTNIKALHHWQVDIKYLCDIPNYVNIWINKIYLYQITFRDYKTWLTLVFFGSNKDKSRVYMAFKIFLSLLWKLWIDSKKVSIQFDGGTEFSNIAINWTKWQLVEFIEANFKSYKIIRIKEKNWHVEAFHLLIEKWLFDTKEIWNLKWKINVKADKSKILNIISKYIQRFNKHWYSSYEPRYEMFGKKSPIQIIKQDWWDKIEYDLLTEIFVAYDVDSWFNMKRNTEYPTLINAVINNKEILNSLEKSELNSILKEIDNSDEPFNPNIQAGRIWVFRYKKRATTSCNLQKHN